jgi:hypothetical protein
LNNFLLDPPKSVLTPTAERGRLATTESKTGNAPEARGKQVLHIGFQQRLGFIAAKMLRYILMEVMKSAKPEIGVEFRLIRPCVLKLADKRTSRH